MANENKSELEEKTNTPASPVRNSKLVTGFCIGLITGAGISLFYDFPRTQPVEDQLLNATGAILGAQFTKYNSLKERAMTSTTSYIGVVCGQILYQIIKY